ELNTALATVAQLNERILSAEASGVTAGDLRDARDLAIDQATRIADVRVLPRSNGSIGLAIGSANIVDGADARPIELSITRGDGGRILSATISTGTTELNPGSALSGALDGIADTAEARAQLDGLARQITAQVNDVHNTAPLNRDFFRQDPAGVTAGNMRLSDDVQANAANVLAGTAGTDN